MARTVLEEIPGIDLDYDFTKAVTPEERFIQLQKFKMRFTKEIMPTYTKLYPQWQQHEKKLPGLKVQPKKEEAKAPEPSVPEGKQEPTPKKTGWHVRFSNKVVSGDPKKESQRRTYLVNG